MYKEFRLLDISDMFYDSLIQEAERKLYDYFSIMVILFFFFILFFINYS